MKSLARVRRGSRIHRSGLAKKKVELVDTLPRLLRDVSPNLRNKRIWVPELNKFVRVKLTARALKTVAKNGAYAPLKKAGLIRFYLYFPKILSKDQTYLYLHWSLVARHL